jgi:hypothetical protein
MLRATRVAPNFERVAPRSFGNRARGARAVRIPNDD